MKKLLHTIFLFLFSTAICTLLPSYTVFQTAAFRMPWKQAGLNEREAAAHLLSRFTFGAKPGEVDQVIKMGLEEWFKAQLDGNINDEFLQGKLIGYDALKITNQVVLDSFLRSATAQKKAINEGFINKDSVNLQDKKVLQDKVNQYKKIKGYKDISELYRQFISHKVLSAAYSENQLHQVLTEFWFNHFNVSVDKVGQFIPAYERDVIRPNVVGKFEDLLLATAKSPAMLFYLDNFNSSGINDQFEKKNAKLNQGLNENYAREIMELHTLGVDGGYTQRDVTEAARVLTGWTVYPLEGLEAAKLGRRAIAKIDETNFKSLGFIHQGDFLFVINGHDNGTKMILNKTFSAGGGYEEGLALIHLLAHHPSTAKFISKKLAIRFVSDNPPQSLIDKMATTFLKSDGDIKQVLTTMVSAPEFWNKDALRSKIKSPFELAISSIRALEAKIDQPFLLYQWISRMGQKLYYYQAPTGFPDKAKYWINTGALLNRMKFGLAFAAQKIPGVKFDLLEINQHHEPAGPIEALKTYSKIMMPERDVDATIKRLEPLVNDPALSQKIDSAAAKKTTAAPMLTEDDEEQATTTKKSDQKLAQQLLKKKGVKDVTMPTAPGNDYPLGQIVGIIIGSPEFQRR